MRTATIQELKSELQTLPPGQLIELTLRLARFKKENKELLTYLLFEAHDTEAYISSVKAEMDEEFTSVPKPVYLAKKTLRKILRIVNKYIRYTGSKQVETELLIYFCDKMKQTGVPLDRNTVLHNLFQQQVKKIEKAIDSQHEDLQYDYRRALQQVLKP